MKTLFEDIQKLVFEEYKKNGYLKEWSNDFSNQNSKQDKIYDIAELALINTEVSEAIEELRRKDYSIDRLAVECADILIRTLNFMSRKGIDAENEILAKHQLNILRGELHGKQI